METEARFMVPQLSENTEIFNEKPLLDHLEDCWPKLSNRVFGYLISSIEINIIIHQIKIQI